MRLNDLGRRGSSRVQRMLEAMLPGERPLTGLPRLALVVVVPGIAFGIAMGMVLTLGVGARPFSVLVLAVVVVTAYGGFRAGLVAVGINIVLSWALYRDAALRTAAGSEVVNVAVLMVSALMTAALVDALRGARMLSGERKQMLDEMERIARERQEAVRKLEGILAVAPVGIAIADDPAARYLRINDEFARMLGVPAGNIGSRSAPPSERPAGFKLCREGRELAPDELPIQLAARSGRPVHEHNLDVVRADGSVRQVMVDAAPVLDEDGRVTGSIGAIMDVTEMREIAKALSQSEKRLRIAVDAMPLFVFSQDADLRYTWFSQVGEGFSAGALLGQRDDAVFPPGDAERVIAVKRRAMETRERVREELTVDFGGEERTFDLTIEPVRANGDVTGIIGAGFDVTERKQLEEALRSSNRAKDDFVGFVSHEMKTPLTVIKGNAELLQRASEALDKDERVRSLEDIHENARRMEHIIDDLLVLARLSEGQTIDRDAVRAQDVAQQVIADHARSHPTRRIALSVAGGVAEIWVSPSALRQVLMNLVSNAEKYSPAERPIEVRIANSDGGVTMSVRDYGRGFTEEESELLFQPFYRSREAAREAPGLGIGLSVCKRLVEAQGGSIGAWRAEGGGAEFSVSFPALRDELETAAATDGRVAT